MTKEKIEALNRLAKAIRLDIIKTGYLSGIKGAHFGGCLSMAEILATLYSDFVKYNLNDLEHRDRVVLEIHHLAPVVGAVDIVRDGIVHGRVGMGIAVVTCRASIDTGHHHCMVEERGIGEGVLLIHEGLCYLWG